MAMSHPASAELQFAWANSRSRHAVPLGLWPDAHVVVCLQVVIPKPHAIVPLCHVSVALLSPTGGAHSTVSQTGDVVAEEVATYLEELATG